MNPILAQTNAEVGSWVTVALLVVNGLVGLGGLLSFLATRREVEGVERRVETMEGDLREMRDRNETDKAELLEAGEGRARRIHERMDAVRTELLGHTEHMRRELNDKVDAMPDRIIANLANFKAFQETK